jgi:type II secretory pathway pseudopilin PulG
VPCDTSALLRDARGLSLTELVVTLALFAMVMAGVVGTWGKAQEAYFIGSESAEVQQNVRAAIDFMVREIRSAGRDATVCAFDYATSTTVDCDGAKVALCTAKLDAPPGTGTPTWQTNNGLSGGGAGCTGLYAIPFAQATGTTLRIRSDRNNNGRIAGMGNAITSPASAADRGEEDVLYALSTTNCPPGVPQCITRDDGTGPVAMVAVDINGLTFTYYPRANFGPCAGVANPCNNAFGLPLADQAEADNIGRIGISVQAQQQIAGQTVSRTLVTEVMLRNRS